MRYNAFWVSNVAQTSEGWDWLMSLTKLMDSVKWAAIDRGNSGQSKWNCYLPRCSNKNTWTWTGKSSLHLLNPLPPLCPYLLSYLKFLFSDPVCNYSIHTESRRKSLLHRQNSGTAFLPVPFPTPTCRPTELGHKEEHAHSLWHASSSM